MTYLNLELIKNHLNLQNFSDDDMYLQHLGSAVEFVVERDIDKKLSKIAEENGGEFPPSLLHAMLLLLGTYYANRENVSYASCVEVPKTYAYICDLYRCYGKTSTEFNTFEEIKRKVDELQQTTKDINTNLGVVKSQVAELAKRDIVGGEGINVKQKDTHIKEVNFNITEVNLGDY
jgi:hypothetical protein